MDVNVRAVIAMPWSAEMKMRLVTEMGSRVFLRELILRKMHILL
jgi:hypothetical protein